LLSAAFAAEPAAALTTGRWRRSVLTGNGDRRDHEDRSNGTGSQ